MIEKGLQNASSFHLAGIVPIAGQPLDYNFPWHDSLQPIAPDYLAVERAVLECADAGCETIWVICNDDMQPLIKYRLGDYVHDPIKYYNAFAHLPKDKQKPIPIFYVPVHPKDRDKRDCLAWSVLYGAMSAYWVSKQISKWTIPDKYYVAFPYGIYPPEFVKSFRKKISSKKNICISYEGLTVKDGEYLGFSFDSDDFIVCRRKLREEGTGIKVPGAEYTKADTLPIEERWSARYFSLDKVFEPVILNDMISIPWYYNIDNWEGLCNYLSSEQRKDMKRPSKDILGYHQSNKIGVDDES